MPRKDHARPEHVIARRAGMMARIVPRVRHLLVQYLDGIVPGGCPRPGDFATSREGPRRLCANLGLVFAEFNRRHANC